MQTYIAILRGINVSGKNMIKMPELSALFEALGVKNVKTYIQSGNVIFQDKQKDTADFEKTLQQKIKERFGYNVPVMVKAKEYIEQVISDNPFVKNNDTDISKLHVTFLSEKPEKTNLDKIKTEQYIPDEFKIIDEAIYLYCPTGYGNTKLNNNFFENKLKVTATTRNWKTVNELMNLASAL
jgi:uncharacterized protein (DUF1697 family)